MTRDALPRDAGFTLLEVLVAVVVLGFILVGLGQGTRFGLLATGTQARVLAERDQLDAVDRTLRRLVEEMEPGTGRGGGLQGTPGRMLFVSSLPAASGLRTPDATVALGVDGTGRFLLRATPRPPGRSFEPAPAPLTTELLTGVDHVELSYYPRGPATGWVTSWPAGTLPLLVRLRVVFPPGNRRHWPDIVAAPQRAAAIEP